MNSEEMFASRWVNDVTDTTKELLKEAGLFELVKTIASQMYHTGRVDVLEEQLKDERRLRRPIGGGTRATGTPPPSQAPSGGVGGGGDSPPAGGESPVPQVDKRE